MYQVEKKENTCVVCCCKLNKTQFCDDHLFRQVSTQTGHYQLPNYSDKLANVQVVINCQIIQTS